MKLDMNKYDKHGKKITLMQWADFYKGDEYRRVSYTNINPSIHVSTVWLGLAHGEDEQGRPLIFESMAFIDGSGGDCCRYATLEEAEAGHEAMVAQFYVDTDMTKAVKVRRPRITKED